MWASFWLRMAGRINWEGEGGKGMCLVGFPQKQTPIGSLRKCSQEESGVRTWGRRGGRYRGAVSASAWSWGKWWVHLEAGQPAFTLLYLRAIPHELLQTLTGLWHSPVEQCQQPKMTSSHAKAEGTHRTGRGLGGHLGGTWTASTTREAWTALVWLCRVCGSCWRQDVHWEVSTGHSGAGREVWAVWGCGEPMRTSPLRCC